MLTNTTEFYGSLAKFFHWIIALLIIGMLFLGFLMTAQTIVDIHQLIGLTILTLVACRLIWTLLNKRPRLPNTVSTLEKFAARTVQTILYLCMFGMPLSGWAMSTAYGFIPHLGNLTFPMPAIGIDQMQGNFFKSIHNTLALVLIGLISLHILGALKHQFIDKNPSVLNSILPRFKK